MKLTGSYRITGSAATPYADVAPLAQALVAAPPDRIVWGTDWPHAIVKIPMPNDGPLLDQLADWVPMRPAAAHPGRQPGGAVPVLMYLTTPIPDRRMTATVRGGHARADRIHRPVEEAVHLVASAAALGGHQLGECSHRIERQTTPQIDVEMSQKGITWRWAR